MSVEPISVADLRYTCPVCMESLFPPVFQCVNGHLMCQACSSRLENCATCRATLPQVTWGRNLEVDRIIRIIKHACPNEIDGCGAKLNFDQVEAHRVQCHFTKFPVYRDILRLSCDEEIRICDYEEHYERNHGSLLVEGEGASTLPVTQDFGIWTMDLETMPQYLARFRFYFEEKPRVFMVVVELDDTRKYLKWKPYVLASRAVANQLNCKISLVSGQDVNVSLASPIFNVETKPEELQACPGLPYEYLQNILDSSQDNETHPRSVIGLKWAQAPPFGFEVYTR